MLISPFCLCILSRFPRIFMGTLWFWKPRRPERAIPFPMRSEPFWNRWMTNLLLILLVQQRSQVIRHCIALRLATPITREVSSITSPNDWEPYRSSRTHGVYKDAWCNKVPNDLVTFLQDRLRIFGRHEDRATTFPLHWARYCTSEFVRCHFKSNI